MSMAKMRVIVVGGFLGSGKTTLLAQAAKHFAAQGKRVGIITNDQAAHLVDTQILKGLNVEVEEVAGGCFCCRFEDLERAASRLFKDFRPDVLLSEPVGSCTDISATVLQPMKQQWGEWVEISPFSVLADPLRLRKTLDDESNFPESVRYIIKKQFEEADYIVINKTDLLSRHELAELREKVASTWCNTKILEISALQDRGVTEWLDTVSGVLGGGNKILEVDYDTYARGEAELGWLNTSISLIAHEETDWDIFALDVICRIQSELSSRSAEIGHLKLLLANSTGQIVANATSISEKPAVHGSMGKDTGAVTIVLNARALVEPDQLKSIVESSIIGVAGEVIEIFSLSMNSFSPAYPRPTHRMARVV
jgi:Ni2+-binding GTPase involved in maturation of urease and hydrogenase